MDNAYLRCGSCSADQYCSQVASGESDNMYLSGGTEEEPDNLYIGNPNDSQSPYLNNSQEDKNNLYMKGGLNKDASPVAYMSKNGQTAEFKSDLEKAVTGKDTKEEKKENTQASFSFEIDMHNYIPIQTQTKAIKEEEKEEDGDSKKEEKPYEKKPATLEDVFNAVKTKQISA